MISKLKSWAKDKADLGKKLQSERSRVRHYAMLHDNTLEEVLHLSARNGELRRRIQELEGPPLFYTRTGILIDDGKDDCVLTFDGLHLITLHQEARERLGISFEIARKYFPEVKEVLNRMHRAKMTAQVEKSPA